MTGKVKYSVLSLMIVLLLSIINILHIRAQWLPDVRLTNDTGYSFIKTETGRNIASWNNYLHITWLDNRTGSNHLYYKRSSDFGNTWSNDTRLTFDSVGADRPSIYVFRNFVYITWSDNRSGNLEIYVKKSTNCGLNWGSDVRITNDTYVSLFPSVAAYGPNVHVCWSDVRPGNPGIFYKRSSDYGVTWGQEVQFNSAANAIYFPSISVTGNTVHAIWEDRRDFTLAGEIYYIRSTDNGANWSNDTRLTFNSANSWMPSMSSSGTNIQIAWIDQRGGFFDIYCKSSLDNGITWGPDNKASNGFEWPANGSVSVFNNDNNVLLTWSDDRNINDEIYFNISTDKGATWPTETRLTFDTAKSGPTSVSGSLNNGYVIWQDTRDGNNEIYFKKNNGINGSYTVSGLVTYADNNQPVSGGYAKALFFDKISKQVFTIDSTVIQPNGTYMFSKISKDTVDLMFYQDDDLLQFVPTYYESTIDWNHSIRIYATENLENINPRVIRINNQTNPFSISGNVTVYDSLLSQNVPLDNAIIYVKQGDLFRNYGITDANGNYTVTKLAAGNYTLVAHRIGYNPVIQNAEITNSSIQNINFSFTNPIGIQQTGITIPVDYFLSQNYPNPFNPSTRIKFGIPTEGFVTVKIFDILGRLISTPVNENLRAGSYEVNWNSDGLTSGVYFYRIESGGYIKTLKMVLLK